MQKQNTKQNQSTQSKAQTKNTKLPQRQISTTPKEAQCQPYT
ncbi:hypothetical protein [Helicobacter sp. MIT 01-3238]|nr:hypothetical protein [Helicobacter sp. MIT 01-3238]